MRWLPLLTLSFSLGARAQGTEPTPPPLPAEAPAPAEKVAPGLSDFLARFIAYDEATGTATLGRERRPLSKVELYQALERPDLVERVETLAARRRLFFILGPAVGVIGIAGGVTALVTAPDLNSAACVENAEVYNTVCVARNSTHQAVAGVSLGVGFVTAAILIGTAAMMDLEPLPREEAQQLVGAYNSGLRRKQRGGDGPGSLRLLPLLSPEGAGLAATFRF